MAQLFAADFPERVETVTLVNTVVSPRYYKRIPGSSEVDDPPLNVDQLYAHFEQSSRRGVRTRASWSGGSSRARRGTKR